MYGQDLHASVTPSGNELVLTFQATIHHVALDALTDFWHGDGSPVGLWTSSTPGSNLFQMWY